MQANTANEHSQMLAQIPANACSDSESRKCRRVAFASVLQHASLGISSLEKQAVRQSIFVSRHRERLIKDDEQA